MLTSLSDWPFVRGTHRFRGHGHIARRQKGRQSDAKHHLTFRLQNFSKTKWTVRGSHLCCRFWFEPKYIFGRKCEWHSHSVSAKNSFVDYIMFNVFASMCSRKRQQNGKIMSKSMAWRQTVFSSCIQKVNFVVDLPTSEPTSFGVSVLWAVMCLVCANQDRPNRKVNRYVGFRMPKKITSLLRTRFPLLFSRFMMKRIYCRTEHLLIYAVLHYYGDQPRVCRAHRYVEWKI